MVAHSDASRHFIRASINAAGISLLTISNCSRKFVNYYWLNITDRMNRISLFQMKINDSFSAVVIAAVAAVTVVGVAAIIIIISVVIVIAVS